MNILSIKEAAEILKYPSPEEMPGNVAAVILPAIDDHIKTATGKDWAKDFPVDPIAKMVASVLLVRWFEDPGLIGKDSDKGIISLMAQLQAKAMTGV